MKQIYILTGAATFLPGVRRFLHRATGGSNSPRYCYSVWMRHLTLAAENGLTQAVPRCVAEVGPGDSIGVGLAALLSGAERYYGLDVVEFANTKHNLAVFDSLVDLFRKRAAIPALDEFPKLKPQITSFDFPSRLLPDRQLNSCLDPVRLERVRMSIIDPKSQDSLIRYAVPWMEKAKIEPNSVDMVISQSALEYINDVAAAIQVMSSWMKPGGFMSHQIDLKSIGMHSLWDGNWCYSDLEWKLVNGGRSYILNRAPYSAYIAAMRSAKLRLVFEQKVVSSSNIRREDLAPRFRDLTNDDLTTSGLFVQAARQFSTH